VRNYTINKDGAKVPLVASFTSTEKAEKREEKGDKKKGYPLSFFLSQSHPSCSLMGGLRQGWDWFKGRLFGERVAAAAVEASGGNE